MATKTYRVTSEMTSGWQVRAEVGQHRMIIDQASAGDTGPNPLDTFLFALAGCVSTIAKMTAREQGFELRGIRVDVSGELNPAGLAGKPSEDPVGFKHIDIQADIDADLDEAAKQAFLELVCARCPVHDNLLRATPVSHQGR
ncbi:OsmC family protein [Oceanimonas sp. CHS3-5]|uniref:OsmC family protein n=1 Tax=Oceanimonas sp. CHS3-5 TaxID=3068186 RepID=UPI00273FFC37|nr:OsmC family protein [Oceanimonas sp. CHS3-5]MDP5293616.1 OsmC family protein [Oceanimonas sp. CHS3-5]